MARKRWNKLGDSRDAQAEYLAAGIRAKGKAGAKVTGEAMSDDRWWDLVCDVGERMGRILGKPVVAEIVPDPRTTYYRAEG